MNKKKILLFIDWFYPGYKAGGPVRSCINLIERLKDEHDFFVVTRNTDYMDKAPYASVKTGEWNDGFVGCQTLYVSSSQVTRSFVKKVVRQIQPDIIYLNGIFSWYFTILPMLSINTKHIKTIIAARGMLAPGALSVKPFKKKIFLAAAKVTGLFRHVIFHATTESERQEISSFFPSAEVRVAPNFVSSRIVSNQKRAQKISGELKLLHIARIAPEKNLLFALEILAGAEGKIIFDFYGSVYDRPYWEKCNAAIRNLPSGISAHYKGEISPDKLPEIFPGHHFLFQPSRGENFGHILIEALASGLPVITSDKTPWSAVEKENAGWALPLAEKEKFIKVIGHCVSMGQHEYSVLSEGAEKYAGRFVNNEDALRQNRLLFS